MSVVKYSIIQGPRLAELKDAMFERKEGPKRVTFVHSPTTDISGIITDCGVDPTEPGQSWILSGIASIIKNHKVPSSEDEQLAPFIAFYRSDVQKGTVIFE